MDNRNRDKMSKESQSSTQAGDINRGVSERQERLGEGNDVEFGKKIGQSEDMSASSGRSSGSSGLSGSSSSGSGSSSPSRDSSSDSGWSDSPSSRNSNSGSDSGRH